MLNEDGQCFTRVPNVLLDQAMAHMGHAELKVVLAVMRKTVGWGKERDRISLTQFEELTGLTRSNVLNGIKQAVLNKWIVQYESSYTSHFRLTLEDGIAAILVKNNQDGTAAIPEMVLKQYQPSTAAVPEIVSKRYTQKKGKKTTKERKEISSNASVEAIETTPIKVPISSDDQQQIPENANTESITDAPACEEQVRPEPARKTKTKLTEHEAARHRELFDAIAQLCVLDAKLAGGMIARTAKLLREADAAASGADLVAFRDWWKTSDWRGRTGQIPTPQQVVNSWLQFRQGYATMSPPRAPERNTISIEKINASLDF